ncbi:hypothetical protein MLD38_005608 [Melastoma candidum]|uniref:Uncharacterized protein n=1 Tax=Melastoma candidum TaxID=119954 RepID=A0ACB9RK05_9MYRT|nr:hypothetical protein MLD38_005608 [Melastoma candidum]
MVNCSPGLVLATTAMVVSTTVAVLAYSRQKSSQEPESSSSPQDQPLRSCLCSSGRRGVKRQKKRVRFAAEDVKEPIIKGATTKSNDVMEGDGLELLQSQTRRGSGRGYSCRDPFDHGAMPANRAALYSCILRDRANRIACSY